LEIVSKTPLLTSHTPTHALLSFFVITVISISISYISIDGPLFHNILVVAIIFQVCMLTGFFFLHIQALSNPHLDQHTIWVYFIFMSNLTWNECSMDPFLYFIFYVKLDMEGVFGMKIEKMEIKRNFWIKVV